MIRLNITKQTPDLIDTPAFENLFNIKNACNWEPFVVKIDKILKNPKTNRYLIQITNNHINKIAYLASQLEPMVIEKKLQKDMFIRIQKYTCTKADKNVIMIVTRLVEM